MRPATHVPTCEEGILSLWPRGGGDAAAWVRGHAWAHTPLGPSATWPDRWKALVQLVLANPLPTALLCGPQYVLIYNEAAARLLGSFHPAAFGRPLADGLPEASLLLAATIDRASGGAPVHIPYERFAAIRGLPARVEAYLTPVTATDGDATCVHVALIEDAAAHRGGASREGEARQTFLLRLSDAVRPLADAEEVQATACRMLGTHLGASRVLYFDVEHGVDGEQDDLYIVHRCYSAPGSAQLTGRYRANAFGTFMADALREGRTVVVEDTISQLQIAAEERGAYLALGIAARIAVPLMKDGLHVATLSVHQDAPRQWTDAEVALVSETAERTWEAVERARAETALRDSKQCLQGLIDGMPQLVWRALEGGEWTWASPQWTSYTGQSAAASQGRGWLLVVHPDDRETALALWRAAARRGAFKAEYRILHAAARRYRWFQTRAACIRNESGAIVEWIGTSTDVDDLRAMRDQQQVMVAELQHRTRNLITVVQSIARETARNSLTVEQFDEKFTDRLTALSRVQGLLSQSDTEPATINTLLRMELDALGADTGSERVILSGPHVALRKSAVQTLALALHELATNARKYGALATADGQLTVSWRVQSSVERGRRLVLDWIETVPCPPRGHAAQVYGSGYGRKLIERALPYSLNATTKYEMDLSGVRCSIDLPLTRGGVRQEGRENARGTTWRWPETAGC